MSYVYNAGDPVTVLLVTEPNGATEPVSILDDAIKQVKKYLNDPTVGPKALITALTTTVGTNATTAATATAAVATSVTNLTTRVSTLETNMGGKAIVTHPGAQSFVQGAGIAPVTFDMEEVDSDGAFNPASYTYTAPTSGLYLVICQLALETSASAAPLDIVEQLDIFVDAASGAIKKFYAGVNEDPRTIEIIRVFNLTVGQTLSAKFQVNVSGGTITRDVIVDSRQTIFQVERLSK